MLSYQVYVQPFKEHINNVLAIINEFSLWWISMIMIIYTTNIKDRDTIDYSGWTIISLWIFNIIINFGIIFFHNIKAKLSRWRSHKVVTHNLKNDNSNIHTFVNVANFGMQSPNIAKVSTCYYNCIIFISFSIKLHLIEQQQWELSDP